LSEELSILDNISIVLVEPQHPGNIGSVARAMVNMGLSKLIVTGNCNLDDLQCRAMATKAAYKIIETTCRAEDLRTAIEPFGVAIAMSRRHGKARIQDFEPRQAAQHTVALAEDNQVAFVFGREDSGLSFEEINYCHYLCTIPSEKIVGSLNLGQAVMIMAYELRIASKDPFASRKARLAGSKTLEGMYDHMKRLYLEIGFLDPANPEWIMQGLRRIYGRLELEEREVAILRGILSDTDWYLDHVAKIGKRDGLENRS